MFARNTHHPSPISNQQSAPISPIHHERPTLSVCHTPPLSVENESSHLIHSNDSKKEATEEGSIDGTAREEGETRNDTDVPRCT